MSWRVVAAFGMVCGGRDGAMRACVVYDHNEYGMQATNQLAPVIFRARPRAKHRTELGHRIACVCARTRSARLQQYHPGVWL